MTNMKIWDDVKQPPPAALKPIKAGRLRGMTDISPQWRYLEATKLFGPCGIGWKYTVDNKWLEEGGNGEVAAFADVSLYVKVGGEWSEAIPGHGGSAFVAMEKVNTSVQRLHTSDEAYKMAITDALSVAFKMLGFGADVYLGHWTGGHYDNEEVDESKIADWVLACEEAAEGPIEDFREWWKKNKVEINKSCGTAGAAQVYATYVKLGKKKANK